MIQISRRARAWSCAFVICAAAFAQNSRAQTFSTPETEYKKRVTVSEDVAPLSENPFGEHIGLYTGSLSFEQTDVSESGLGPGISITRSFVLPDQNPSYAFHAFHSNAFVDWDLEVPHIETMSAPTKVVTGGNVTYQWYLQDDFYGTVRCSELGQAPSMVVSFGSSTGTYAPEQWWHGYHLIVPGAGSQTLLTRSTSNTQFPAMTNSDGSVIPFPITTKDHWAIGCLKNTSNGQPGEGYLAVSPDGTKYYLDVLQTRSADAVLGAPGVALKRNLLILTASKVVDRFGNTVTYTYNADGNLVAIQGDDGRRVDLTWESWLAPTADPGPGIPVTQYTSFRITQIDEQLSSTNHRSWKYTYDTANPQIPRLKTVTLPDLTTWQFNLSGLPATNPESLLEYGSQGTCQYTLFPNASVSGSGTVTGPSGVTGQFWAKTTIRGRAKVPVTCSNPATIGVLPRVYATTSITQRQITGAGLTPQTWTYAYSAANESWAENCGACTTTVYTEVTDPASNVTRTTFSNAFDATEGLLQKTEMYSGTATGAPLKSETIGYAQAGPWPSPLGSTNQIDLNDAPIAQVTPTSSRIITLRGVDGSSDTFSWSASAFNAFGQPTSTSRSSSTNPAHILSETFSYLNDYSHWVLGLPVEQDNVGNGDVEALTTYDSATALPISRSRFGQKVEDFTYYANGQLNTFTDSLGHKTTLLNYQRGVPTQVLFADGMSEAYTVNEFGEIASKSDKSGNVVQYTYWPSGRIHQVIYPSGDATAWATKAYTFDFVASAERGVEANHLRRTVTQGNTATVTYFDAMLHPLLTESYQLSDGALRTTTRSDYDWRGKLTKQYYAMGGVPDKTSFSKGVATSYDALGRPSVVAQDIGPTTQVYVTTAYLSGGRKQVTDANNAVTTTAYQMLDVPSYEKPVSILAPLGVTQTIVRDDYGNPTKIVQSGDASVVKTFAYDGQYRLCRVTEPESASTINSYDSAGNLAWSAAGVSYTASTDEHDCGTSAGATAPKISRSYNVLNQLSGVQYADTTPARDLQYSPTGKPSKVIAGGATWEYQYNKRDLLSLERLSIDGYVWEFVYSYDGNGSLSSIKYPDGSVVAANPDALGHPTTASTFATGAEYYPDGKLASFLFGSGAAYSALENDRGLLSSISYGTPSALAISQDFTYDNNANLTLLDDFAGTMSRTKHLGYDALNRLISAEADSLWGTDVYSYDALNNITKVQNGTSSTVYSYDPLGRFSAAITNGSTGTAYQYDVYGNVTQRNGQTFLYDQANRLTSVSGGSTYSYDANGRRVKQVNAAGKITYSLYSQTGALLMQVDAASGIATDFIYLGKKLVATQTNTLSPSGIPTLTVPLSGQANQPFTVSWTSVAQATSYNLQESSAGAPFSTVASPTGINQVLSRANAGTYTYRVQACNSGGCGAWSISQSIAIAPPPSAPLPPSSVSDVVANDWSSIVVSWSASTTATFYNVQQKYNSGAWTALVSNITATSSSATNPPDGSYSFQVQACNQYGCSAWTTSPTVGVARIPSTPAAISAPATSTGNVAIGWSISAYATGYSLEQSFNGGSYTVLASPATNSFSYVAGASGSYAYRVRGCNANGCSGYSPIGITVVTLKPTSAPTISVPGSSTTGNYTVSWSAVVGATSYTLQEELNGGAFVTVQSSSATSLGITGKGNGIYGYQVQACNASGCGPWSGVASISVALPPPVPTGLTLTTTGPNDKKTVHLAWNASAGATSYQLEQTLYNTTPTIEYNGPATTWLRYFLYSGPVQYRVKACNASGCSAFSAYVNTFLLNAD